MHKESTDLSKLGNRISITELIKFDEISKIYLCKFDGIKSILRKDMPLSKSLNLDRKREVDILYKIKDLSLSPQILYSDHKSGIMIWRYVDGVEIDIFSDKHERILAEFGRQVKKVHSFSTENIEKYNFLHSIETYKNIISDTSNSSLVGEMNALINTLYSKNTQFKLCHNDLTKPNILMNGSVSLLDWEYACLNDPYFDLATIFSNFQLDKVSIEFFLKGYGDDFNLDSHKLNQFIKLVKLTEKAWSESIKALI